MAQTFNIGDKVRILVSPYHNVPKNQIGRIVKVRTKGTSGGRMPKYGPLYELDVSVGSCTNFWGHELEMAGP